MVLAFPGKRVNRLGSEVKSITGSWPRKDRLERQQDNPFYC